MYYVLSIRYYKGQAQLVGLFFKKKWSRICGLNPRLIYVMGVPVPPFLMHPPLDPACTSPPPLPITFKTFVSPSLFSGPPIFKVS